MLCYVNCSLFTVRMKLLLLYCCGKQKVCSLFRPAKRTIYLHENIAVSAGSISHTLEGLLTVHCTQEIVENRSQAKL